MFLCECMCVGGGGGGQRGCNTSKQFLQNGTYCFAQVPQNHVANMLTAFQVPQNHGSKQADCFSSFGEISAEFCQGTYKDARIFICQ